MTTQEAIEMVRRIKLGDRIYNRDTEALQHLIQVAENRVPLQPKYEIGLISVGFHKGEVDFSVNCSVSELTIEELKQVREMIPTAIYVMEDMWRRNNPNKVADAPLHQPREVKDDHTGSDY